MSDISENSEISKKGLLGSTEFCWQNSQQNETRQNDKDSWKDTSHQVNEPSLALNHKEDSKQRQGSCPFPTMEISQESVHIPCKFTKCISGAWSEALFKTRYNFSSGPMYLINYLHKNLKY